MERYRKQQSELYFTEAGKRKLAEAVSASAQPRIRRSRRLPVIAAIAAALALTVSAGALSPGIREMLSGVLGGFTDYAQDIETDAAVDQGIEIKVVSAMADSTAVVVYAEARDLTGDRLRGGLQVTGWINNQADAPGTSSVERAECVGYDEESGTALLKFIRMNGQPGAKAEAVDLELNIFRFQPQELPFQELPLPSGLPTGETLRSFRPAAEDILPNGLTMGSPDDPLVLEPEQTPADLGSDLVSLSSAGFAADGRLHVQLSVTPDACTSSSSILTTIRSRYVETLDMSTDENIQTANEIIESYNEEGYACIWFTRDGGLYYDMSFPAGPDVLDDLLLDTVYGTITLAEPVTGRWSIPLTVETLSDVRIPLPGPLCGISDAELVLSPLSIAVYTADSSQNDCMSIQLSPVTAYLLNGTQIDGALQGGTFSGDGSFYCSGTFAEPVDLDQLTEIAIGEWMIPMENGAAREPYLING